MEKIFPRDDERTLTHFLGEIVPLAGDRFYSQNAERVFGFPKFLFCAALIRDKAAADLYERHAVFGKGIEPRDRTGAHTSNFSRVRAGFPPSSARMWITCIFFQAEFFDRLA